MAKKDNLTLGQIRKRMWSVPSYDTSNAKRTGDFIEGIPVYQNPDGMRILKREDAEMKMSDAERQEAVQELKAAQNYGSPSSSDSLGSKDVLTPEEYRRYRLDNTLETMQKNSEEMTKKYGADWRNSSPYGMSVGNDKDSVLPLYFTPAWPVAAGMNTINAAQNYNRGSRTEYVWDKDSQQSVPVNVPYDGKNLATDMALEWAVPGAMHVGGNAIAKYGLKGAIPGLIRDAKELPKDISNAVTKTVTNTLDRVGNVDVRRFTPRLSEARMRYYDDPSVPLSDALRYQRDRFKFTLENPEHKPRFWTEFNAKSLNPSPNRGTPYSLKESAQNSTSAFQDVKDSGLFGINRNTYYSPVMASEDMNDLTAFSPYLFENTKAVNKQIENTGFDLGFYFDEPKDKWLTDILDSPYKDQLLPIIGKDIQDGVLTTNSVPKEYIKDLLTRVYGDLYRGVRIEGADIHNPGFAVNDLYEGGKNYHGFNQSAPNLNTTEYQLARGYSIHPGSDSHLPLTLDEAKLAYENGKALPSAPKGRITLRAKRTETTPAMYKYTPKIDGAIDPSSLSQSIANVNKMFEDANIRIVGDHLGRQMKPIMDINLPAETTMKFLPDLNERQVYLAGKRNLMDGTVNNTYTIFEPRDPSKPYSFDMFDVTPVDPLQPVPESVENRGTILPLLYDESGNFPKYTSPKPRYVIRKKKGRS